MNDKPLTFALGDTYKTFTVSTISDSDMDDETVNLLSDSFRLTLLRERIRHRN